MTITIRPLKKTDNFALYPIYSNPHVTLMAGFNPVKNQLQLNQLIEELMKTSDVILLNGKVIGLIECDDLGNGNGMLGYLLHEAYWHHGYATKACELYLKKLKKDGYQTIYADCFLENLASCRILEKLHFTYLQDFEREYPDFEKPKQCHLYKIDF